MATVIKQIFIGKYIRHQLSGNVMKRITTLLLGFTLSDMLPEITLYFLYPEVSSVMSSISWSTG